jgi:HAD superfamily hydrolase (TIGR01549 family)
VSAGGRRFDAVLFDWDDTLCFAEPHRYLHAREVACAFGVELSLAEVYRAFLRAGDSAFQPWQTFVSRLPAELGIDPDQHGSFIHAYRLRDMYKQFQLFDDVLELIDHLHARGLRVGLISNNDEVAHYVHLLDVKHRFEVVVSPETFGVAKPHAAIFHQALALMDVPPERALYVGDSYDNDVVGARAAGLTPVLVDRFAVHGDGLDAEHRVATLAALADALDDLLVG